MGSDVVVRNRATFDRLRGAADGLVDDDLRRVVDPPWTIAALFAHVGFWDRFVRLRWQQAADLGHNTPVPIEDHPLNFVNDAALPGWLAIPPRIAVELCLEAAEALDHFVATLSESLVRGLVQDGRERLVDRSIHRSEHLDRIERGLTDRA